MGGWVPERRDAATPQVLRALDAMRMSVYLDLGTCEHAEHAEHALLNPGSGAGSLPHLRSGWYGTEA